MFMGHSVIVYRNRALATLQRMLEPTVTMDFSDAGISIQSDLGDGNISCGRLLKFDLSRGMVGLYREMALLDHPHRDPDQ